MIQIKHFTATHSGQSSLQSSLDLTTEDFLFKDSIYQGQNGPTAHRTQIAV